MDDSTKLIGKPHAGSRVVDPRLLDAPPMVLHVPSAPHRPGAVPKYSAPQFQPGDLPRPDPLADYCELRDHAAGMIRVLGDDGAASGPWHPQPSPQQLRSGLEVMLRTRHLDARMMAMQ